MGFLLQLGAAKGRGSLQVEGASRRGLWLAVAPGGGGEGGAGGEKESGGEEGPPGGGRSLIYRSPKVYRYGCGQLFRVQ